MLYIVSLDELINLILAHLKCLILSPGQRCLSVKVKMPKWDSQWTPTQDAALLQGVERYGFGSWDAIKVDNDLKLGTYILQSDPKKVR